MNKWSPEQIDVFDRAIQFAREKIAPIQLHLDSFSEENPYGLHAVVLQPCRSVATDKPAPYLAAKLTLPIERCKHLRGRKEDYRFGGLVWLDEEELCYGSISITKVMTEFGFPRIWLEKDPSTQVEMNGLRRQIIARYTAKPDYQNNLVINPQRIRIRK